MTNQARRAFMNLKSKSKRTENDEGNFHFANKPFKTESDLDKMQAGVTAIVTTPRKKIHLERKKYCGGLMCAATGARRILKRKCELIAQHLILFLMISIRI